MQHATQEDDLTANAASHPLDMMCESSIREEIQNISHTLMAEISLGAVSTRRGNPGTPMQPHANGIRPADLQLQHCFTINVNNSGDYI